MTEEAKKKPRAGGIAADQLRSIIERIEALEEQKATIGADIKDVYAEAKGNGFAPDAIRSIIRLRKLDASERDEKEHILDTYRRALGMLPDLDEDESDEDAEGSDEE